MRVLVACEFSGIVRRAFVKAGHAVTSCDLLDAEDSANYSCAGSLGFHWKGELFKFLAWRNTNQFDLMVAHPPCTHLAVSGARWFKNKPVEQVMALAFVRQIMGTDIPRICVENPISIISSRIRKPDQIIQPWQFGHGETKATCLWLKNLPKLVSTNIVAGRAAKVHRMPPGPDRWKDRSRTYTGIAEAMAAQWGAL